MCVEFQCKINSLFSLVSLNNLVKNHCLPSTNLSINDNENIDHLTQSDIPNIESSQTKRSIPLDEQENRTSTNNDIENGIFKLKNNILINMKVFLF